MTRPRGLLLVLLCSLSAANPAWADDPEDAPPAIFKSQPLSEALAQAKASGGIVIVDFTAEWCAPCKMMERTVLRDPRVEKWMKDRKAVAIRVDTDKEGALRTEYGISAWPTFIGFKGAEMIDRRLGSMTSDQFLAWLEKVDRGNQPAPGSETVVLPAPKAPEAQDLSKLSIKDRLDGARALVSAAHWDKATKEYLWLWTSAPKTDAGFAAVRRTVLRDEIASLTERAPDAMAAFVRERDEAERRLKSDAKTFDDLLDWIALNTIVAQDDKTLEWLDRIKGQPDAAATLGKAAPLLKGVLERRKRWADLALLIPDPIGAVHAAHEQFVASKPSPAGDDAFKARVRESYRELFRAEAATIYLSQLAAGRETVAEQVAAEAITLDDTPAMRVKLVSMAVNEGKPRRSQRGLLDQAAAKGSDVSDLRKKLEAAPN